MVYDGRPPPNTGPDPRTRDHRVGRTVEPNDPATGVPTTEMVRVTRPNDDAAAAQAMAARYGRPAVPRRRVGIAVIAVGVAALLVWVVWAAIGQSRNNVGGLVESFDVKSPHAMSVTVQITRGSTKAVHCTVVALATDHSEVGQRVVRLPAGPSGTLTVTTLVRTERGATAADIVDCR